MKYSKLTVERRRVFTLVAADIDHELLREASNGAYTYSEYAARKSLLESSQFQWDCAAFGFPSEMVVHESDNPDTFDVDVFWRD